MAALLSHDTNRHSSRHVHKNKQTNTHTQEKQLIAGETGKTHDQETQMHLRKGQMITETRHVCGYEGTVKTDSDERDDVSTF